MKLARSGKIKKYDTVVMLSINGTQLYDNKQSDTWIYIWILVNLTPDKHYKMQNILPVGLHCCPNVVIGRGSGFLI